MDSDRTTRAWQITTVWVNFLDRADVMFLASPERHSGQVTCGIREPL